MNILHDMRVIINNMCLTCFGGDDVSESKQHCRREALLTVSLYIVLSQVEVLVSCPIPPT